jgi:cytidine deaminase
VPAVPPGAAADGTVMAAQRHAVRGDGTVWLVADRRDGQYGCYWYTGPSDGRLDEHARVDNVTDAVAWGRARSPRVRIRDVEGRSSWAGTAARPYGINRDWNPSC